MSSQGNSVPNWTVSIIAQVDNDNPEGNEWEYQILENTILTNHRASNIRYVIFKFLQKEYTGKVQVLEPGQEEFTELENTTTSYDSLYDPAKLTEFFTDQVFVNNIWGGEKSYQMLITWGHGAGLSYFDFDSGIPSKTKAILLKGMRNGKAIKPE